MLDRARAGTPEQYRSCGLSCDNKSELNSHWKYELKTLPRPKDRDTRAVVTMCYGRQPNRMTC